MHNYEKLLRKIRYKEIVLWVGAGFSKYAGVPMGGELVDLIKRNATKTEMTILKNMNSLPEVAEEFVRMRGNTKTELITIMKNALQVDINTNDLASHNALKNIPQIDTIITTNFDNLFEQSFGSNIEVIIKDESIATAFSDINKNKIKLLKVHSDFTNPELMVITKSDYTDFFRNGVNRPLWTEVKSIIAKKSILFIGYSYEDQNVQFIFDNIIEQLGVFKHECFFVTPYIPEYKVAYLQGKNISYIPMSAEKLMSKIEKDIKDTLIEDCNNGLLPHTVVRKILEKEGINVEFQIHENDTYLSSIGVLKEDMEADINISFKDDDSSSFVESMEKLDRLFQGESFERIVIPGKFLDKVEGKIKDICIPFLTSESKSLEMFLEPYPEEMFKCYLSLENEEEIIEDVLFKRYKSRYLVQTEFIHKCFKITYGFKLIDFENGKSIIDKIHFSIEPYTPSTIFEGNKVFKYILKWLEGEELSAHKINEHLTIPLKIPANCSDMQRIVIFFKRRVFVYSNLIRIQKFFNVRINPPLEEQFEDIETIHFLTNIINNNGDLKLDLLPLEWKDIECIKVNSKEQLFLFDMMGEEDEIVNLFGVQINLGVAHVKCQDAYIENYDLLKSPDSNEKTAIIKSKSGNIVMEYSNLNKKDK